jgi:hypothetical protein
MYAWNEEYDEYARLVLMEQDPMLISLIDLSAFIRDMKTLTGMGLLEVNVYRQRYIGYRDRGIPPTHDYRTGKRVGRK